MAINSPRILSFIIQLLRARKGGEKLSQEALQQLVPTVQKQFESYYNSGLAILLNASDHVWKDDNHEVALKARGYGSKHGREHQVIRLEASTLLFDLATKSITLEVVEKCANKGIKVSEELKRR